MKQGNQPVNQYVFITGTDTEVGKTLISTAWLHRLRTANNCRVAGFKPVSAGTDAAGHNEDAIAMLAESARGLTYDDINPVALPLAAAPELAAITAGRKVELQALYQAAQNLVAKVDCVVAEGAGGWRVPVNAHETLADLAKQLNWPVVLVVGLRLGCLNHALLTAEAIRADGLKILGWVANHLQPNWPDAEFNIACLQQRLDAPLLAEVPFMNVPQAAEVARFLHV